MYTSNSDPNNRLNTVAWYLIAEYTLSEFLSDYDKGGEPTAGWLFQAMRELNVPLEYIKDIEMTLKGFAKGALALFKQGSLELPGRIRVFCQQKMIDAASAAQTSRLYKAEQAMEDKKLIHHSGTKINGGFGYFLIKRGGNVFDGASLSSHHSIDLYLYRER